MTSVGRAWRLVAGLALASAAAVAGRGVLAAVAARPELGAGRAWLRPGHAPEILLATPLLVMASLLLFLAPGILWARAFARGGGLAVLAVRAFVAALVAAVAGTLLAHAVLPEPLPAGGFLAVHALLTAGAAALLLVRAHRGAAGGPALEAGDGRRLAALAGLVLVLCVVLIPKLFWEDFTGDGYEAFEFGRSLARHPLPFWKLSHGVYGFFLNFSLFAYVNHFFLQLVGPEELAARLPILLYLAATACGVVALAEAGRRERLGPAAEAVLGLGLATLAVVVCANISYDPWFADVAEPAATDLLGVACFLAAVAGLWRREPWLWATGALLATLCSPFAVALLGLLGLGSLALRPGERLRTLGWLALAAAPILAVTALYELYYLPRVLAQQSVELSVGGLLEKYRHLRVQDLSRLAFLVFPSGIVPALALLWWPAQDRRARLLALVTLSYFAMIYVRAYAAPHQYIPVFVLPLAVFWRVYLGRTAATRRWLLPAAAAGAVVALALSLPRHGGVDGQVRRVGSAVDFRIGDYQEGYLEAMDHALVLKQAFTPTYGIADPSAEWGVSPYPLLYYALGPGARPGPKNYRVQRAQEPLPEGWTRVAEVDGAVLAVRDLALWEAHRHPGLAAPYRSPLYHVPNRLRFEHLAPEGYAVDVRVLGGRLKDRLLAAAGAEEAPAAVRVEGSTAYRVAFARYVGGRGKESMRDVAFDPAGNLVVAGGSDSPDAVPTFRYCGEGDRDPCGGSNLDVWIEKIAPDGRTLWSVRLGGRLHDRAYAVETDAAGNVYVAGRAGPGFRTTEGALQRRFAGDRAVVEAYGPQDGFAAKLSPEGRLLWSTYFGTPGPGFVRDLDVDPLGQVALVLSRVMPWPAAQAHVTPGAFQERHRGERAALVAKLASDGSRVLWATFLGGSGESGYQPTVRLEPASGEVHVAMGTRSTDDPVTPDAFQAHSGGGVDLHLARLSADGRRLLYGTYFGGSGNEGSDTHYLALDARGRDVLGAGTQSPDLPVTEGAFQRAPGGAYDLLVARFGRDGALEASTYVGGAEGEVGEGVAVDADGRVYVSAGAGSSDFPTTTGARLAGARDLALVVLEPDLRRLAFSTLLGGPGDENGRAIAVDARSGAVALAGEIRGGGFPVRGGVPSAFGGARDGLVVRFAPPGAAAAGSPQAAAARASSSRR